jgi:hypothetical protein
VLWQRNGLAGRPSNLLRGLLAFLAAASCFVMRGMHKLARFGLRRKKMNLLRKRATQIALGMAIFAAGIAAGSLHARSAAVQNRFGQPKTVLHVVVYKFRDNVSNYDRERAINGIKDMAGKIPGIKNVWVKTARNQIKDFSGVYAIEFTSAEAAADYSESPVHEAWSKTWQEQRENSLSFQVTNP